MILSFIYKFKANCRIISCYSKTKQNISHLFEEKGISFRDLFWKTI